MNNVNNCDNLIFIKKKKKNSNCLKISLASEQQIRSWSYGEVINSETINYKTLIPEFGGLFCQRIFGPIKDYVCSCGKYKGEQYCGTICDICLVEVNNSNVRRYRMGHIELATPVIHYWFLKIFPSFLSTILMISSTEINKIINNDMYIVITPDITNFRFGSIISSDQYHQLVNEFDNNFVAYTGMEGIYHYLKNVDLSYVRDSIYKKYLHETSIISKNKLKKKIFIIDNFINSKNAPESMVIKILPVLPPELRPLVKLDSGKFANSDLNILYRRVINRNNRLKKLIESLAPVDFIINEKKLLQESVNCLIDNESAAKPFLNTYTKKPLKSIANILKGKYGRFRSNLLGKRVDYSGRSVIVVGPNLKINQFGLPKRMAIELFKPFILNKLLDEKYNFTICEAQSLLDNKHPLVFNLVNEIVQNYPILLNRAPTLHRLGIQAFYPVLVSGNAIKLHPLVCSAFNADFDGDQMAVHIPLTVEARLEAINLMLSVNNILSPSSGNPVFLPSQDSILGIYYLTRFKIDNTLKNVKIFTNIYDVKSYYDLGYISLSEQIKIFGLNGHDCYIMTSVGRVILFYYLPSYFDFSLINVSLKKKTISDLLKICYLSYGLNNSIKISEILTKVGFKYASRFGLSISLRDIDIKYNKKDIISNALIEVNNINLQFTKKLISFSEKYFEILNVWNNVKECIKFILSDTISSEKILNSVGLIKKNDSYNNINLMIQSGARGTLDQLLQLSGMRGLMSKPSGRIIEQPILSSFYNGLNSFDYFISTHGARKGLSDTALKTANAGYLTRRLVDVGQDVFITQYNCNSINGIIFSKNLNSNYYKNIYGRILSEDVLNPFDLEILFKKDTLILDDELNLIKKYNIDTIKLRSIIYCDCVNGVCSYCYGIDLSKNKLVNLGESVGIIAAQSIGEPGTQLTMRTFHSGGANLFTINTNKKFKIFTKWSGFCRMVNFKFLTNKFGIKINLSLSAKLNIYNSIGCIIGSINIPYGVKVLCKDFQYLSNNDIVAEYINDNLNLFSYHNGIVCFRNFIFGLNAQRICINNINKIVINYNSFKNKPYIIINDNGIEFKYNLLNKSIVLVENNQYINIGDIISYISNKNSETLDITGGLVKIANLFEARHNINQFNICLQSGIVESIDDFKYNKSLIISNDYQGINFDFSLNSNINILKGVWLDRGDILSNNDINLNDLLEVKGLDYTLNFFINELQSVYSLHGIQINSKHIEIIFNQMVKKCVLVSFEDNENINNELIDYKTFMDQKDDKDNLYCIRKILGITKSALLTKSFISAASFQETSRVLTEAAFFGKEDDLYGIKENVILGNLIPSGTGFNYEENE